MLGVPDATYFEASRKLRQEWAGAVQEALDQMSPRVFGRDAALDLSRAVYSAAHARGSVVIPVTGRTRFWGAREVTGCVRIHGEQMFVGGGNSTAINLYDKNGAERALAFFSDRYATRELVKRTLIASHNIP